MTNLTDLGFSKGVIVETIVSTYSKDGQPNAAPVGAIMQNNQALTMTLFVSSSTYKNLQTGRCAVINVTSNIDLFFRTAFKETNPVPQDWFIKAQTVNAPCIQTADATVEISVTNMKPIKPEKIEATCNVEQVKAAKILPQAYCRAQFATMEAILHATRVKVFLNGDEKQKKQAAKLLRTIDICKDVVHRTAPNSQYAKIMIELTKMIDTWRKPT